MGLAEWAKDVAKTDRTAYGQSVVLDIDTNPVKIREIELNPIAEPPEGYCKTVPSTCGKERNGEICGICDLNYWLGLS